MSVERTDSGVSAASIEAELRGSAPAAPARRLSRKVKRALIGGAVLLVVGAAVTIAVLGTSTGTQGINVPARFSGSFVVNQPDPSAPAFSGTVVKTSPEGASSTEEWDVSFSYTTEDDTHRTTWSYVGDRGYYQAFDVASGVMTSAGCMTPADVPPVQGFGASLDVASEVDADHVSPAVKEACKGSTTYAARFFGQTYVYCYPDQTHTLVGSTFSASLVAVSTMGVEHGSPPRGVDGAPLDCPVLDVAGAATAVATERRLAGAFEPRTEEDAWYLREDLRRRLGEHEDENGCCGCRRRLWFEEAYAAPAADEPRRLAWKRLRSASTTSRTVASRVRKTVTSYPGVTLPTTTPKGPNSRSNAIFRPDNDDATTRPCLCCMLAGIETTSGTWGSPSFCGSTVEVAYDTSKPWDDPDTLDAICDQIAGGHTGQTINAAMHVFGQSTGNLALAKAVTSGRCVFPSDGDNFWTLVEGILPLTNDPALFCTHMTTRYGQYLGPPNICHQVGGAWVPTTAGLALASDYSGRSTVNSYIKDNVDSVIYIPTQTTFGNGVSYPSTGSITSALQSLRSEPSFDSKSISTDIAAAGTATLVPVNSNPIASSMGTSSAQWWGAPSMNQNGATSSAGLSPVGHYRRLGGGGDDLTTTQAPRTTDGGMDTLGNFYTYLDSDVALA